MSSTADRIEKDLQDLVVLGGKLAESLNREANQAKFDEALLDEMSEERANEYTSDLPNFHRRYDFWYSKSLVLIKQLLPDRLSNFVSFYERAKNRKSIARENYTIRDYLDGIEIIDNSDFIPVKEANPVAVKFNQQLAILRTAKSRLKDLIFDIKQLMQADLFDSEIDSARELAKNKFYRAAGAVVGVVLEKHLHQVCDDHNIQVKENPGINVMSNALKAESFIDQKQWRHISMLADIRNKCAHKGDEPTQQDIEDLIEGTYRILRTIS